VISKLLLNGPADVKMRARLGWSWDLLTKAVEYKIKSNIVSMGKYNLIIIFESTHINIEKLINYKYINFWSRDFHAHE